MSYDKNKIKKNIRKYEYISFDMFDTLIKRDVKYYKDIYSIVEKEFNKISKEIKIENFKEIREKAENEAKIKYQEPTLTEIYNQMNFKPDVINKLLKLEKEVELNVCHINKDFSEILEYTQQLNKKIIITTDMYHEENLLKEILKKEKINYNYIYVSSKYRKTKREGSLFDVILKDLNINKNQMLHIGDSKKADFIIPNLRGINSILIERENDVKRYSNNKENKELQSFINCRIPLENNEYYRIGYETLGPLLYGFSKYLEENLKKQKINKIYFLAREGWILKKAFEIVNNDIESIYFCASRHSLRVPLLSYTNSLDEVLQILQLRRLANVRDFFKNVDLNINTYQDALEKYNLQPETSIKDEKFKAFYPEIEQDIKSHSRDREKFLIGYLKSFNFENKIAISDVGWVGTMQKSLKKILNQYDMDIEINGYYMGLNGLYHNNPEEKNMFQYLFTTDEEYEKVRAFLNLFESFFLANHGTTLYYEIKNEQYVPVFDEYEYDKKEEQKYREIQQGALDFVREFKEFKYNYFFKFNSLEAFANMEKLGLDPTTNDVELFGKISYIETNKNEFANPKKITAYLKKPKQFYYDFCNCSWKIGFLKKSLKININYFKIYKVLDKLSKKAGEKR